jgi:hypothetical protein
VRSDHPRRPLASLGSIVAAALLLAACGAEEPPPDDDPATQDELPEVPEHAGPADEAPEATPEGGRAEREADVAREEEGAPDETPEEAEAVEVPELLDFTAPAVGGGRIEGGDLAGQPVALWFWAPW